MNRENKQNKKITNLCPNTSIIALSIYGLNIPIIEISRVEKNNSKLICCLQETHFIYNGVSKSKVKVKGYKKT